MSPVRGLAHAPGMRLKDLGEATSNGMNLLIITQKVDARDQLLGFFIGWLKRFSEKFEKIIVICLEKGEFNLPENVRVISLGKDKGESKLKQLFNFYFLLFTLNKNYDAVFVHMNPIWVVLGSFSWRLLGKKIYFWYTSGGVTLKLRLAEKMADVIFTASKESFRLPLEKVIVTGHGIDTELFKSTNDQRLMTNDQQLKILSVGRIAPVKNYETLIDAVKLLKDKIVRHPMSNMIDFRVTVVGEVPLEQDKKYEESLKFKVKSLGLENNFHFVGKVFHKDLPQYYQSHDVFIHLSKTGSLDKTILEAMACGMKVLSSNDASRSFLPQNLVFDDKNPQELANKILELKDHDFDQDLRQYVVENHNLDNLINKISQTINESRTKSCSRPGRESLQDLGKATSYGMNKIAVYPFPFSSGSNLYIDLLYGPFKRGEVGGDFDIVDSVGSFINLIKSSRKYGSYDKNIIHIHWIIVIFGSKFIIKSLFLFVINFFIILFLKKFKKYKICWTMHNYSSHDYPHPFIDKIGRKILFKIADRIIIQQKKEFDKLSHISKIVYVPIANYINAYGPISGDKLFLRKKFNLANDDVVLLSLGLIRPYKKIENIIKSFRVVADKKDNLKLVIVGSCKLQYCDKLKKMADGSKNIIFDFGFVEDKSVPNYLVGADYSIFWFDNSVLTSAGLMLTLSYGVPAIIRSITASELIKEGENGFIYKDHKELGEILLNLDRVSMNPVNVINSIREFSQQNIVRQLSEIYKTI